MDRIEEIKEVVCSSCGLEGNVYHCPTFENRPCGKLLEVENANLLAALEEQEREGNDFRQWLWLNHGHITLYGDDGEMQCQECFPVYDYKRFALKELITQVIEVQNEQAEATMAKLRAQLVDVITDKEEAERRYTNCLEEKEKKIKRLKVSAAIDLDVARDLIRERDQAELTMAKLRAQLVDAITDKEEAERRYTNCLEEKEKELESWRGSRDGVLEQITECEYRELQAEAKYKACHEELIRCNNDLIECRKVALHRPCPILFTVIKPC
jgi:DNA repair exonuclease SbcCD ATPase subunit